MLKSSQSSSWKNWAEERQPQGWYVMRWAPPSPSRSPLASSRNTSSKPVGVRSPPFTQTTFGASLYRAPSQRPYALALLAFKTGVSLT